MDLVFGRDIFLETDHPIALSSNDRLDHLREAGNRSGSVHDFTDGAAFGRELLAAFPGGRTLIDLGTATGTVPLTMRGVGLLAVGLEGSEAAREDGLGAWKGAPEIVATCDLGEPFQIAGARGEPFTFDFVTSWGTLEHLTAAGLHHCLASIDALLGPDSVGVLNIDLAYNPADDFHMLWTDFVGDDADKVAFLRTAISEHLDIDDALAAGPWRYCRPTDGEREALRHDRLPPDHDRTYWWVRPRQSSPRFSATRKFVAFSDDRPGDHATMFGPSGDRLRFRDDLSRFDDGRRRYTWVFERSSESPSGRHVFAVADRAVAAEVTPKSVCTVCTLVRGAEVAHGDGGKPLALLVRS